MDKIINNRSSVFIGKDDKIYTVGLDIEGWVTFLDENNFVLLKVTQAVFEGMAQSLGLTMTIFNNQINSYLDERFNRLEKLLGA